MAITVKHSKVSAIPDGADASVVRPSDWNADHEVVGDLFDQSLNTTDSPTFSSITTTSDTIAIGYEAGKGGQETGAIAIGSHAGATAELVYEFNSADGTVLAVTQLITDEPPSGAPVFVVGATNVPTIVEVWGDYEFSISEPLTGTILPGATVTIPIPQQPGSIAIGGLAGSGQGGGSVAIGSEAGKYRQDGNSVAVGFLAGRYMQGDGAVAIGSGVATAGQGGRSIAIGQSAGGGGYYGASDVTISGTTLTLISTNDIYVGDYVVVAGATNAPRVASIDSSTELTLDSELQGGFFFDEDNPIEFKRPQGYGAVAIGAWSGQTNQGNNAIAIGQSAGYLNQGVDSVAIGQTAGVFSQGVESVAIGGYAGMSSQGQNSIAIGQSAGNLNQGQNSVSIGQSAGNFSQGQNSVAIGQSAGSNGQGQDSIAIGRYAGNFSQPSNSIILNATGVVINGEESFACYVGPIREDATSTAKTIHYDPTTKELTYADSNGRSFRNKIINGKMEIAQRGTSFPAIANAAYSLDRWVFGNGSIAVITASQQSEVPTGNEFQSSLRLAVTTSDASISAGNFSFTGQIIEGYNARDLIGRDFTLSFRVRSSKTGIHCVALRNSGNDRSYIAEYTVNAANTWETKSVTVPGGLITAGTWDWTNGRGLQLGFALAAGSTFQTTPNAWRTGNFLATANQVNCLDTIDNIFAITGVQLEAGSVATPFEHRHYQTELAMCRRYARVQTYYIPATTAQNLGTIDMRVTPTITGGGTEFTSTDTTADQLIAYRTTAGTATLTLNAEI